MRTLAAFLIAPALSVDEGTAGDAAAYALREAASPEAQGFVGGDSIVISIGFFTLIIILLIVILCSD